MERRARPEDVDAICGSLPETELGTSWGDLPTWKVPRGGRGKGFLIRRAPRSDAIDPDTGQPWHDLLVIPVADLGLRQAMVEEDNPFFTIDHFRNTAAVLVSESRLGELDLAELREVLTEAWALRAPKRLVQQYFDQHP